MNNIFLFSNANISIFIFIEKYIYFIFREAEDVYTLRKAEG